jgi:hypothetical protein
MPPKGKKYIRQMRRDGKAWAQILSLSDSSHYMLSWTILFLKDALLTVAAFFRVL